MIDIINSFWNNLKDVTYYYKQQDKYLLFDENQYDNFEATFKNKYNYIKEQFMASNVEYLDRHKVAALLIITSLELDLIKYDKPLGDKKIFLGKEMIITEVAFNWMLKSLNEELNKLHLPNIESYFMPKAFACKTSHFEVFCRNLYYSGQDGVFNPLLLSENLFLLEYITLIKNNVNPELLHPKTF